MTVITCTILPNILQLLLSTSVDPEFTLNTLGDLQPEPRVPGLTRDCTRDNNNCVNTRLPILALHMTKKILFESLYLVLGMSIFEPWVNCPYATTTPTVNCTIISRFMWKKIPTWPLIFFFITIHEVILSDPFFELVQNTILVRFSYLAKVTLFWYCGKRPRGRDMRKLQQKCQKIAGCWGRAVYVHNFRSLRHLAHPLWNDRV